MLRDALGMRYLLMGPDNAFGRGREGNPARLSEIGAEIGFDVDVLDAPLERGAGRVSATAIRQALTNGDMATAASLLGRPYALRGPVVRGAERGRTIGFPTANIHVTPDRALPAYGVYITRAEFAGQHYASATNIGIKPTFDDERPSVETYLLDFEGDLYGRELRIEMLERLRGEIKFSGIDALVEQIRGDVEATRGYFRSHEL
jgi:riboflavin kinase/FMN adenylyltransferase